LKSIKFTLLFFLLFCSISLARDINLDEIYIKRTSPLLKKLIFEKLDTYEKVNAVFVDRDVIFSGWISGDRIIYIKEAPGNINIIYRYHTRKQKNEAIYRLKGLITYAHIAWKGRYVFLKRLIQKEGTIPDGERVIINLESKEVIISQTVSPFLDFSIPANGNSILYESKRGFVEFYPDPGTRRLILERRRYQDIVTSKNPSIAFLSPDRRKILVINGGGGSYRGKIIQGRKSFRIAGISSATELCWIDNYNILFRRGSAGSFSAILYNVKRRRSKILIRNSLNTNISFSFHSRIISLIRDQVILLYFTRGRKLMNIGLEGEDVSFEPNGKYFTSLIFKKLFIVNLNTIIRKRIELRRSWRSLLRLYRDLSTDSGHYENEYSAHYIRRKVFLYRSLLRQ
jgi:hypothetical protein